MDDFTVLHAAADSEQTKLARKSTRYERVQMNLAWVRTIATIAVLGVVIGAVMRFGPQLTDTLTQANTAVRSLNTVANQLEQADLPAMLVEIDTLVANAQLTMGAATRTMESSLAVIESVNLAELNAAIGDFAAVVEPLARLFGR